MLDPDKAVIGDPVPLILRSWLQTWRRAVARQLLRNVVDRLVPHAL
jgi:hypothetical protein